MDNALLHTYTHTIFPRILPTECANMWVQLEGRNKPRADSINIAALLCWYAHSSFSTFSPNECEICKNLHKWSSLYSWANIHNDFNKFRCTLRCYSNDWTVEHWATPTKIIMHTHGVGTIRGWGYLVQLEPDNQCGNSSRGRENSRDMVYTHNYIPSSNSLACGY